MWPPLLFRERSFVMKAVLGGILPLLFGALCGFLMGTSNVWFTVVSTAGIVGGVSAGFEHVGWRDGFVRGITGGALFAIALVAVHVGRGVPLVAYLPASLGVSAVIYGAMGAPFGVLGGWLRAKREARGVG
jgi:hypothetical protein